jgi:Flp pilus assembly protein TadG
MVLLMLLITKETSNNRRGAAVVEFALVLPLLMLLFAMAVDFARVYFNSQIVADCARLGAHYIANPDLGDRTEYDSAEAIIAECAKNLSPAPTVSIVQDKNAAPPYVEVTVTHRFKRLCPLALPALPAEIEVIRKSRARLYPAALESE